MVCHLVRLRFLWSSVRDDGVGNGIYLIYVLFEHSGLGAAFVVVFYAGRSGLLILNGSKSRSGNRLLRFIHG